MGPKIQKTCFQDVARFRAEYERSGPMVKGIPPREAVERLKRLLGLSTTVILLSVLGSAFSMLLLLPMTVGNSYIENTSEDVGIVIDFEIDFGQCIGDLPKTGVLIFSGIPKM